MKLKAVIIGFAHMHVNEVALYISEQPDFTLVAVADLPGNEGKNLNFRYTLGWNLKNVRDKYCGKVYDDYRSMLDKEKPDIAFIMTENSVKPEVVEECARRGVHVSIEKPIAASLAEAKRIQNTVNWYGIEAVVNWPVMWRPYLHKMKAALDERLVGEPLKLRYINGHTGPLGKGAKHRGVSDDADEMSDVQRGQTWWYKKKLGGGVILDIGCYGCFFSKWFMGDHQKSVIASGSNVNTPYGDIEDNYTAVIRHENGLSVIEGTWTTPRIVIPSGPMVVCTEGVILCTGGAEQNPGVAAYNCYGNVIEIPEFETGSAFFNMPWHYASHRKKGTPIHPMLTLNKNAEIMAMLDAVITSTQSGREEEICEVQRTDC